MPARQRHGLGRRQGRRERRRAAGRRPGAMRRGSAVGRGAAAGAAFSQVDGAQRLGHLHRLGVLQVDDVQVAGGAGRRIEHRDEAAQPRDARRVVRARNQAVRARIGHHDQALRGVGWPPRRLRRLGEQAVHRLRDVERRGVRERDHHRVGAAGLVDRVDDPRDALQVAGVVGDHQGVARRIDGDGVRRRDQRAQDRHELRRRFVLQREDLGLDLVAGGARALAGPTVRPWCSLASASGMIFTTPRSSTAA